MKYQSVIFQRKWEKNPNTTLAQSQGYYYQKRRVKLNIKGMLPTYYSQCTVQYPLVSVFAWVFKLLGAEPWWVVSKASV